jgi:hypothetical protein
LRDRSPKGRRPTELRQRSKNDSEPLIFCVGMALDRRARWLFTV